jgi:VanZ family protein
MVSGGLQQPLAGGTRSGREICVAWLWTALWIIAIYVFAGDHFSAKDTGRFLGPLLRWLLRGTDADSIAAMHFAIRKAAHIAEYAVLSALGLRALRLSFARPTAWVAASTLALVLVVAAVDEFRQARSAKRTGAVTDVALDFAGGVAALVVALAVQRRRSLPT